MNVCIRGTIPIAVGLSSSAALEVAGVILFSHVNKLSLPVADLIALARSAECDFVGVKCGIMDQFISMMGMKGHALFLDCESLRYEHVPCPSEMRVVICDTGTRRELASSAYNFRRAETEEARRIIREHFGPGIGFRQISLSRLEEISHLFPPAIGRRARHVISENERVWHAVEAIRSGDLHKFGRLMADSHRSLRDDFEVSTRELDAVVDIAHGLPGMYGARMTGAGFGGAAICLVRPGHVEESLDALRTRYLSRIGKPLSMYLTAPADGASVFEPGKMDSPVRFAREMK
jgi:galactokinase